MIALAKKSAVGITWSRTRKCCAVRIERRGYKALTTATWRCVADSEENLADSISEGVRAVSRGKNDIVVGGGEESDCAFGDVYLPYLTGSDLRDALRHELARIAPLEPEQLTWGYRLLPSSEKKLHVRIIFMREAFWNHWIDLVNNLPGGLDMVIPPLAALDPVLSDKPVYFPSHVSDLAFTAVPAGNYERRFVGATPAETPVFGTGSNPLEAEGVDPGEIKNMPEEDQQAFRGAVLLGLYGTSASVEKDRKTWVQLPFELQPRRYRVSKMTTLFLTLFLIIAGGYGLYDAYSTNQKQLEEIRERTKEIRQRMEEMQTVQSNMRPLEPLQKELKKPRFHRPSVTECLAELTGIIPTELWVTRFKWNSGEIRMELRTDKQQIEVMESLEESPYFSDVIPLRKTITQDGVLKLRVKMFVVSSSEAS